LLHLGSLLPRVRDFHPWDVPKRKKEASDFLDDFRETYKALQKIPFYQFHDNNYRFLPFAKFPYVAFFIVDESSKTVFLNAVFHISQNPAKYPAR